MRQVKSSHHAVGAGFLIGLSEFAPPTLHAMAARVAVNSRLFNVGFTADYDALPGIRDGHRPPARGVR